MHTHNQEPSGVGSPPYHEQLWSSNFVTRSCWRFLAQPCPRTPVFEHADEARHGTSISLASFLTNDRNRHQGNCWSDNPYAPTNDIHCPKARNREKQGCKCRGLGRDVKSTPSSPSASTRNIQQSTIHFTIFLPGNHVRSSKALASQSSAPVASAIKSLSFFPSLSFSSV